MIHAHRPRFAALFMIMGALAALPAHALDLEGLDDVTMRVIDANEKPAKLTPQMIALPKPNSPPAIANVTTGAPSPAKAVAPPAGSTAIGIMKSN